MQGGLMGGLTDHDLKEDDAKINLHYSDAEYTNMTHLYNCPDDVQIKDQPCDQLF